MRRMYSELESVATGPAGTTKQTSFSFDNIMRFMNLLNCELMIRTVFNTAVSKFGLERVG